MGHTHEDIDACFGTIASWFDRTIIQTPQEYKLALEAAFAGGNTLTVIFHIITIYYYVLTNIMIVFVYLSLSILL